MKKLNFVLITTIIFLSLLFTSCIRQTIHRDMSFFENYTYEDVWLASVQAVNDIGFTIDNMDKTSGFIAAESGTHIGQEVPPRISIMISEFKGRIYVDCKVLQKEQFIDIFGHGKRIYRNFMVALNLNLHDYLQTGS